MDYKTNGIRNKCSDYTLIDVETRLCEDCSENELTFTEAIQKYDRITNDKGETYYYKDNEGDIYKNYAKGLSCSINANIDFLLSTGWEEYKDKQLVLPKATNYGMSYYAISSTGSLVVDKQLNNSIDKDRLKVFNYFTDKEFAQYITDRQLLDRIELVLYAYNKDTMDDKTLTKLINEYIDTHYEEVLNRVLDYQDKM